jgi:hypothetical protein
MGCNRRQMIGAVAAAALLAGAWPRLGGADGDAPQLGDLYTSRAILAAGDAPQPVNRGNPGMHFLAFARDGLDSFYRDDNGDYYAYYVLWAADARGRKKAMVGLARTRDGVTFRDHPGPVLRTSDDDRAPDSLMNSFPSVWKEGPTWYMVTEIKGPHNEGHIGLALSDDGVNWRKSQVILQNRPTGWERVNIGTPYLIRERGLWYLYYHGYDLYRCQIGVAVGPDLTQLRRANRGEPVIATRGEGNFGGTAGKRSIVKEGGLYYMAYDVSAPPSPTHGYDRSNWTTTVARSADLIHWDPIGGAILPTTHQQPDYDPAGTAVTYGFNGPEWFRDPAGRWHLYYMPPGNGVRTRRVTLTPLPSLNSAPAARDLVLKPGRDLAHQVGRPHGDGWAADVRFDPPGRFLSYGPRTRDVQPGARRALFRLMLTDQPRHDAVILTADVYEPATRTVLNSREIRRSDFPAPGISRDFSVDFYASPGYELEFRTFWHGGASVRQDRVTVTAVTSPPR